MLGNRIVRMMQYNIRHEKATVIASLLEDEEVKGMDILAIQEPWIDSRTKSSYNPGSGKSNI